MKKHLTRIGITFVVVSIFTWLFLIQNNITFKSIAFWIGLVYLVIIGMVELFYQIYQRVNNAPNEPIDNDFDINDY